MFAVVLVVSFVANVLASFVFSRVFHVGGIYWDTSSTTAVTTAIILGWALSRKKT